MNEEAVRALAPDDASRFAAAAVARSRDWYGTGSDDTRAWGTVAGSAAARYDVVVEVEDEAVTAAACTCPSRKRPCKHALALLLKLVRGELSTASMPASFGPVLEGARAAAAAPPPAPRRSDEVLDPEAQAKRRQRRTANVDAGVGDLARWLEDLVAGGLASARSRSHSAYDEAAARLVDAQAPGLAARVRSLAATVHGGAGWPDRTLVELADLFLLVEAWRRIDHLPAPVASQVRTQVGFTTGRGDVLASTAVRDHWDVLASVTVENPDLTTRRVWLRGETVGGWGLLLDHVPAGGRFDVAAEVGSTFEAGVHRYPGAGSFRVLVGERHGVPAPMAGFTGASIEDALAGHALAVAANPWLPQTPVALGAVLPVAGEPWHVVDEAGDALALGGPSWTLLAVSGGSPVGVVGEWDGEVLWPLTCWDGHRLVAVEVEAGPSAPSRGEPWAVLVKTALLGTARLAGRTGEDLAGALGSGGADPGTAALLPAITVEASGTLERALLARSSVLAVAARAARIPSPAPPVPEAVSIVDGRPAPPELAEMGPVLCADGHRAVLAELVERCAAADVRLPPSLLPFVLDVASTGGEAAAQMRRWLPAAAGERGRWLAARNERWAWLLETAAPPHDVGGAFDLGSSAERLVLARRLRRTQPDRLVELLARTWRGDRAPERAALVATLEVGLSTRDEPFLEEVALADRARDVRAAAARLLDRLPESRRGRRMAGRADAALSVASQSDPGAVPADWAADGIDGRGEARRAALQVLAATPLDHWGPDLGAAIHRVATAGGDIVDDRFGALVRAAVAQRRDDWIVALLAAGSRTVHARTLLRAAPPPLGAVWLAPLLAKAPVREAALLMELLHTIPRPWPAALVAEVLRRGVEVVSLFPHVPGDVSVHLHLVGERADAVLLPRLVPDLAAIRTHEVRLDRAFRAAHGIAHLRLQVLSLLPLDR